MTSNREPDEDTTVQQLAALYTEHQRSAGPLQRTANRATAALGRPLSLSIVLLLVIAWVVGNYIAERLGWSALEKLPYPNLEFVATVTALLVALLILTAQRHQDELGEKRARLTLQIAAMSEKKIAKVIALLEEQRRDNPLLATRLDAEAEAMAQATDPKTSLEQLEQLERDS